MNRPTHPERELQEGTRILQQAAELTAPHCSQNKLRGAEPRGVTGRARTPPSLGGRFVKWLTQSPWLPSVSLPPPPREGVIARLGAHSDGGGLQAAWSPPRSPQVPS